MARAPDFTLYSEDLNLGDKHAAKDEELCRRATDLGLGDLKAFVERGDNLALLR